MQVFSPSILEGVKRGFPIVLGYLPVAFAFGVLAVKNNITPELAIAMSVFFFAGSGQFIMASLWGSGVGVLSVVLTIFVVNLRHLLMSASLATNMKNATRFQRFLMGCELTDETFGVHSTAFRNGWQLSLSTLYACNITAHLSWITGTIIGVYFGTLISDVRPLGLDYALTAMFLALLVPQLYRRIDILVALFAGILSVVLKLNGLGQWNVIVAAVAGATLGLYLYGRKMRVRRNK